MASKDHLAGPNRKVRFRRILFYFSVFLSSAWLSCSTQAIKLIPVGKGWSKNSINAVIFRKNSIVSYKDQQYVAYYDSLSSVIVANRKLGDEKWNLEITPFSGGTGDAHNSISLMTDGAGYLHMTWDHHNNPLNYAKSNYPGSLQFVKINEMIGTHEKRVTYPEFYPFSNGNLLFVYRDGASGIGNLIMNLYEHDIGKWTRLHSNLIDGEDRRNAYWQICLDKRDQIRLSRVWRETGDVTTNHDICYARSNDYGRSWQKSNGALYQLPINQASAEIVYPVSQGSNLMNQTSMTSDSKGRIYIANYFKSNSEQNTQIQVVYFDGNTWEIISPKHRKTDFHLGGGGTRSLPLSRPQIIATDIGNQIYILVLFRDEELGNSVCLSYCSDLDWIWKTRVVYTENLNRWEPSYDTELWRHQNKLHLFVQNVGQGDAEKITDPTEIKILEMDIQKNRKLLLK